MGSVGELGFRGLLRVLLGVWCFGVWLLSVLEGLLGVVFWFWFAGVGSVVVACCG